MFREYIHASREHVNLAWRTVNLFRKRMNLIPRTVNACGERVNLAGRTANSMSGRIHAIENGRVPAEATSVENSGCGRRPLNRKLAGVASRIILGDVVRDLLISRIGGFWPKLAVLWAVSIFNFDRLIVVTMHGHSAGGCSLPPRRRAANGDRDGPRETHSGDPHDLSVFMAATADLAFRHALLFAMQNTFRKVNTKRTTYEEAGRELLTLDELYGSMGRAVVPATMWSAMNSAFALESRWMRLAQRFLVMQTIR